MTNSPALFGAIPLPFASLVWLALGGDALPI